MIVQVQILILELFHIALFIFIVLKLQSLEKRILLNEKNGVRNIQDIYKDLRQLDALYGFLVQTSNRKVRRLWARTIAPAADEIVSTEVDREYQEDSK